MTYETPITDADLHAYADGQLTAARRREVEAYLREHPDAVRSVEAYRSLNRGLRRLYAPVLEEPVPQHLLPKSPRRRAPVWRAAAAVAWMAVGGAVGWQLQPAVMTSVMAEAPTERDLVLPAAFAHVVYAADARHPVEVSGRDEQHLVGWLSKRLGADIKAPDLSAVGYVLVGGRLLPSTDRMAAQFMYERADGLRVTLYTRRGLWENELSAFRYAQEDGVGVFYWVEGPMGYALVGGLPRQELLALSEAVHHQL